jgi:hypothetical protein
VPPLQPGPDRPEDRSGTVGLRDPGQALDRFKQGRIAYTGNVSADLVKAAASGTADYEKDVDARAYSQGGMLLELSLGVQSFNFRPAQAPDQEAAPRP